MFLDYNHPQYCTYMKGFEQIPELIINPARGLALLSWGWSYWCGAKRRVAGWVAGGWDDDITSDEMDH